MSGRKSSSSRRRTGRVSRRDFLAGSGAALSGAAFAGGLAAQTPSTTDVVVPSHDVHIQLTVNGVLRRLDVTAVTTLAEALREGLGLTGVKIGCNRGECGACTVLLDDNPVYSCSQLAALVDGSTVVTIEGLATTDVLDPVQQAFIEQDALQCGFCTPGQIMAARGLLNRQPQPTEADVRRALSGNLCRCGCYNHIVTAVLAAAGRDVKV